MKKPYCTLSDSDDPDDEELAFEFQRAARLQRAGAFLATRHAELEQATQQVTVAENRVLSVSGGQHPLRLPRVVKATVRSSPRHAAASRAGRARTDRQRRAKAQYALAKAQEKLEVAELHVKQAQAYVERLEEVDVDEVPLSCFQQNGQITNLFQHSLYPAGSWDGSDCSTDATGDTQAYGPQASWRIIPKEEVLKERKRRRAYRARCVMLELGLTSDSGDE